MFLLSVSDVECAVKDRKLFRFLSEEERWEVQGYPASFATLCDKMMGRQLTGNAYPVPMLYGMLQPVLKQIGASGVVTATGPCRLTQEEMGSLSVVPAGPVRRVRRSLTPSHSVGSNASASSEEDGMGSSEKRARLSSEDQESERP
jgi:hypothetical protein